MAYMKKGKNLICDKCNKKVSKVSLCQTYPGYICDECWMDEANKDFLNREKIIVSEQNNFLMELRDRFAMAALPGLLTTLKDPADIAEWSYKYADDMMREREKWMKKY